MPANPPSPRRLLVVQVAGLGLQTYRDSQALRTALGGLQAHPLQPPFPAVTCTAQATFRTATPPAVHGVVANGWLDRPLRHTTFWEQSARLVDGPRIWDGLRARDGRVAILFWQQSLGESADITLSPAPVHLHGGGLVDACYSQPADLAEAAAILLREPFRLSRYWGPLASTRSSRWIAQATALLMSGKLTDAPDLCLTYLPALDYDFQRHGPGHRTAARALRELAGDLATLRDASARHGYDLLIWGDYAITSGGGEVLFPNRLLHEAGLMQTRVIRGRHYPDLHTSRAFAVVDHQIAHVYVANRQDIQAVREALAACGEIRPREEVPELNHPRAGELILTASPRSWFAYPWRRHRHEAPDYARHIDIHNKPGYDPCELFFGWPPGSVSLNPARVGGVHGLQSDASMACWISDAPFEPRPHTLCTLAETVGRHLESLK